ncbi:MAG: Tat pathway signal sequence [Eggerthellaceae bacterium]|nr:Tat pathway signal sequence [Eggerthellaceae bacterium]
MPDPNQQGPMSWADLLNQFGGGAGGAGGSQGPSAGGHRGGSEFDMLRTRFAQMSKKAIVVLAVVILIIAAFCYWWFHPPINIHSVDLWMFLAIFVLFPSFLVFFIFHQIYERGMGKREKNEKKAKRFKGLMVVPVIVALVGVLGAVASLTLFPGNAEKYSTILNTEDGDFATDIEQADYSTIPFIDRDSAVLLGNRTMGTMADYVSQFEISDLYSQINYQDAPVRVSPLNYADVFKWWSNHNTGIPAYVIVNMSTQDTQIVRLEDPIYYSDSDPFFNNVDRHVQLSHPFYIFGEKSFEIDDNGKPYWIYPVIDYTVGLFGGETVSRVVLCDASTGECQDLAIDEVPQWVDRAYPADLLIQQYNWSGALSGGWINSWLGQSGVKQTTPGSDGQLGYNYIAKDDDVWVYSGVTSATADNSIIGFVLINQRTAESKFYPVAGATEESAMSSAEGQVQNLKYEATFPLLINVDNQPTYFMALKDNAGLVKKYAMIDIQRYQNVAVGDTLEETEKSYKKLLRANGVSTDDDSGKATKTNGTATGTVSLISPVVLDGNSHYYVMLNGDGTLYDCPVANVVDIVRFKEGDSVTLTVSGDNGDVATVSAVSQANDAGSSNASA